ncbi:serine/threonine-protein kinase [Streptomyces jeddahensis]|uniref:Serine/threonine-protein kinase AfsK n=1 Tax=Streptomyces jeddahensis TaxID=1716141 RepID=A0A177HN89_9ACTN|nr:serine/threonine-protein kinase [Streptomyces jeddahensis]OAH12472.1 serine/threonine-protein kinase AfsK [Streptomyces jeddahensis]
MEELRPGDPRIVGPFQLLGRLGTGGMGRVFLGRSAQGRTVAVKLVHPELAVDPEFRQRFRREVQAARRVVGEWTAAVVAADTEAAVPWAATAYIPALSLQEAVQRHGCLPEETVWALAFGLARALETIHGCGLVHRDLKPSNVLLGLDGPRVIDFGIARAMDGDGLTRTGMVVGTPGFISPEQVNGEPATGASDVFCLGSVLVFAATGRSPFPATGGGVAAGLLAVVSRPPSLDGLSGPLRDVAEACLAQEAARRPLPERIAEMAESAGYDRSRPWLPPELLDHLGRQAARLLEVETPPPTALDQAARQPSPDWPTQTAAPRPSAPAGPPPPSPHPSPSPSPHWGPVPTSPSSLPTTRRVRKWPLFLAAAALVLVGALAPRMLTDTSEKTEGTATPGPTTSAVSASPQSAFRYPGTWRGTVTQGDSNHYPVKAVYKGGKVGDVVATVDYPTLECSGRWVLISQSDKGLAVKEQITEGRSNCSDVVEINLTPSTDGTLGYAFADWEEGQATLRRD